MIRETVCNIPWAYHSHDYEHDDSSK